MSKVTCPLHPSVNEVSPSSSAEENLAPLVILVKDEGSWSLSVNQ